LHVLSQANVIYRDTTMLTSGVFPFPLEPLYEWIEDLAITFFLLSYIVDYKRNTIFN